MNDVLAERAPAKINLTLHVLGRRVDGFHELDSLVAFSGFGDHLRLLPGKTLSLAVDGPTAQAAGADADNLVLRAAHALLARREGLTTGTLLLTKRLPVAAGIGGGSSDAGAALRLIARANGIAMDDPVLLDAARATGSDVPVCFRPRARRMAGAGEHIGEALDLPPFHAVLVNPRVGVETARVFAALALPRGESIPGAQHPPVASGMSRPEWLALLGAARNDLETPALGIASVIGEALALFRGARGCRLARMSGSGATVFGLFDNRADASRAAGMVSSCRPAWWVKPALLR